MEIIQKFCLDTSGASMVEYGLLIAFIALACFTAVTTLGLNVILPYNNASATFSGS